MSRLWSCGFEKNDLTLGVEITNISSPSPTISSSTISTGSYSLRCNPTSPDNHYVTKEIVSTTEPLYFAFYIRIASYPNVNTRIFQNQNNSNQEVVTMRLNTNGTLGFWDGISTVQIGSNSNALSLNTWYRIEIRCEDTGGLGNVLSARLNGVEFAGRTTGPTVGATSFRSYFGLFETSGVTGDIYFDDIAINDTTGLSENSYPGLPVDDLVKPYNLNIGNILPSNLDINSIYRTERSYTVTIKANQSMGLLLALTYKTGFTVTTNKSP